MVSSASSLERAAARFFSASRCAFALREGLSPSSPEPGRAASWAVVTLTFITTPVVPGGTTSDVSRTSAAFSAKMARSNFSSGESSVSPFGVTLPTRMSPGCTSAPTRTMPSGPRFLSACSPTFGMSRVISSVPSFVSRAPQSKVMMWSDVSVSSRTRRSFTRMASSKLYPRQLMNATSRFLPSASSPWSVAGPSARQSPFWTFCPCLTIGFWLKQVPALQRRNFWSV